MKAIKHYLLIISAFIILHSCSPADGNQPGHEYMPDMAHSIAVEANTYNYYYYNTWDSASTIRLYDLIKTPREPVEGTRPRGYAGWDVASEDQREAVLASLQGESSLNAIKTPLNGSVPYYYEDTEEERTRAIAEILDNPFPITEEGLARGKELYDIFCAICHGEKGDGVGYLVAEENPNVRYPAAPANFLLEEHVNSSNGRYYHAIMHGKNVMGGYADKISFEERWQVIHYIRSLQAKELKVEYSQIANSLNEAYGVPGGTLVAMEAIEDEEVMPGEANPVEEEESHGSGH